MVDEDFEHYVSQILRATPRGLTVDQFRARCESDIRGGYSAEVTEARRRYFVSELGFARRPTS